MSGLAANNRVVFALLMVYLAWLPIPLGSNRPWAWALLELGAYGLFAWWCLGYWRGVQTLNSAVTSARAGFWILGLWLGYLFFQCIPLPAWLLGVLSPGTREFYLTAFPDQGGAGSLSLDRGATLEQFLRTGAYGALFFLVLALTTSRERLVGLAGTLAVVGVVESLFGLSVFFAGADSWYQHWLWQLSEGAAYAVTGTYVNRNHFAGLMEVTIAMALGLALARYSGGYLVNGVRAHLWGLSEMLLDGRGALLFSVLIMLAAMVFSTSRGGIVSLGLAVLTLTILAATRFGRRSVEVRLAPWLLLAAALAGLWLGYGQLAREMEATGLSSNRLEIWAPVRHMVADRPLTGSGAGTFRWLYPAYKQDAGLGGLFFEHAHNDYLEILAEQGLIGLGLSGLFVGFCLRRLFQAWGRRGDRLARGILFGSLTGSLALLIHATVDFNFQIPANAAYFFVLLATGLVASGIPSKERP